MIPLRLAVGRIERAFRDEEEVLAVTAEFRRTHIEPPVCDLDLIFLRQPVEVDVGESAHLGFREGQPLAVRRPDEIADLEGVRLGHRSYLLRLHLDELEAVELVGPGDAFGIGRPGDLVLVGVGSRGQRTRFTRSLLRPDPNFILAALVTDIADPFAVWRPHRIALMHPGCLRQVAGGPILGRHREHIAPRTDERSRTVRSDLIGRGLLADIAQPAAADRQIFPNLHRNSHRFLRLEIPAEQVAAIFKDNPGVAQGRELNGEFGEVRQTAGLPGFQVHHIEVGLMRLLALRDEINPISVPHGEDVLRRIAGKTGGFTGPEMMQPNLVGLAAAVALPGAEFAEDSVVGHLLTIRGETAPSTARHRQGLRNSAGEPRQRQFSFERVPVVPARAINHRVIVLPGNDDVVGAHPIRNIIAFQGRGVGEATRFSALGRHHIDLGVAIVLTGEGQCFAVRREAGEHLEPFRVGGQAPGDASLHGHGVEVSGIGEHHLVSVQCGEPQQPSLVGLKRQHRSEP